MSNNTLYHGIINIYKEKGFTSHDVVAKLRGILKQKKIGHTGTLDPDAIGVLPVCLGMGTKLCDMLTDKDKTYEAVMLLGYVTDTQDMSGKILEENETLRENFTDEQIVEAIKSFEGDYMQTPPMYSAIKVNGKKLYELAREGIEIEVKPRPVIINEISDIKIDFPRVYMTVDCSKGTYIRTLCHDIGKKLGVGAAMESLKRTKVGHFNIVNALKLDEVSEIVQNDPEKINEYIMPVTEAFKQYKDGTVKAEFDRFLYNGNSLKANYIKDFKELKLTDMENIKLYDSNGKFVGVYAYIRKENIFKVVKMFLS